MRSGGESRPLDTLHVCALRLLERKASIRRRREHDVRYAEKHRQTGRRERLHGERPVVEFSTCLLIDSL